jgi:hypothetical protein
MNKITQIIESKDFSKLKEVETLIYEHFPTVKVSINIENISFDFRNNSKPSGLTAISMRNMNEGYGVFIDFNGWDSHLNHKVGYVFTTNKNLAIDVLTFLTLSQLK